MCSIKRIINRDKHSNCDSEVEASANVTLGSKVNKSSKFEDVKGKFDFASISQPVMPKLTAPDAGSSSSDVARININDFFSVDISNRYGVLADAPSDTMDTLPAPIASTADAAVPAATEAAPAKSVKPPPICFVSKLTKNLSVFREYCDSVSKNYYFHFASDRTLLYYRDIKDYKTFLSKYKDLLPFYTYTPRQEKTYAFLIKGLHASVECEDVKSELKELEIDARSVIQFKNSRNPIFMCVVGKNVSLKDLQNKGRYLQRTKVYYEHYINKKEITQCKKCQMWGHATSNCFLKYARCVKCAGQHLSYECDKSREVPAVCANCGKDHPASSLQCEVYLKHLEDKNQKSVKQRLVAESRTAKRPTYINAPPPAENAWTRRRQSRDPQPAAASNMPAMLPERPRRTTPPNEQVNNNIPGTTEHHGLEDTRSSLNAIESIADIMRDIRKMCDLEWLAGVLGELRAEMSKCTNVVEYAIAVDNFNSKYQHKLRCP